MTELSRRQALAAAGSVSLGALLAACGEGERAASTPAATATPTTTATAATTADAFDDAASCTVTPELTEGPYYFDADAIRSDIRDGREGVDLRLALRVRDAAECTPIADAVVDIWHCDALGDYSQPGETFMRGTQVTNADGVVEFRTVYPGWYRGRTVHIHAKVHLDRTTVLTTQLFFDDEVTARVYERAPYSRRTGRDRSNDGDGIFDDRVVMTTREDGDGYRAALTFDVSRT